MTYRLPPLNALRAFEAAARHLSFKQAAVELHVTPGAVSQQVKALEDSLGVRLFERIHNGLMLTVEGQQYLTPIRSAFTNITTATEMVSPREARTPLVVGAEPQFAIKWLVPKMLDFQQRHPDVRVSIGEAVSPEAVVQGDVDIAILPGASAYSGLRCDLVLEELLCPVCAAEHVEDVRPSLDESVILIAEDAGAWEAWLEESGGPRLSSLTRIDFSERSLAIRAALAGRGLAMGSTVLEARELEEGRLIRPFDTAVRCGASYYAVYAAGRADCPPDQAFLDWLLATGREEAKAPVAA